MRIDDTISYQRRVSSSTERWAIVGVVATIVCAITGIIAILPSSWTRGGVIEGAQVRIATAIAPVGFVVAKNGLTRVKKNSSFAMDEGDSFILETKKGGDTVSLARFDYEGLHLVVNGAPHIVSIGEHVQTSEEGCFVWNTHRETSILALFGGRPEWTFEYHCNSG